MKIKTDVIRLGKYLKPQPVSRLGEWLGDLWLACCPWLHPAFALKCKQVLLATLPGRQHAGQNCCGVWAWPQWLDHALFMQPGKEQEIPYGLCMLWEQCCWWEGKCPFPQPCSARLCLEALTLNYMINVPAGALSVGYISKCHSLNRPFQSKQLVSAHLRSKGQASACVFAWAPAASHLWSLMELPARAELCALRDLHRDPGEKPEPWDRQLLCAMELSWCIFLALARSSPLSSWVVVVNAVRGSQVLHNACYLAGETRGSFKGGW